MSGLAGSRVLIVGGTSGIGLACAAALAEEGATVTVASRTAERVQRAIERFPQLRGAVADTADPGSLRSLVSQTGPLDHVVSAAGHGSAGRLLDLDDDAVRAPFDSKVLGQLAVARAVTPALSGSGSLTLFSGLYGARPAPGAGAVAMANAAVEVMGAVLARELAPIRVNVVSPGLVDTPAYDGLPAEVRDAMFDAAGAALPAGRAGRPGDVVPVVRACLESAWLTGAVLHVDGGGMAA